MALKAKYNKKLVVILGPNASGKSSLAVYLAKEFNGEVISADSRQVYKGMDIGSGKIMTKEMQSIPHHLLDVASPKRRFTVTQYQKKANNAIKQIYKNGNLPIICGGTGFYIQSVVDGIIIPKVKPDWKFRNLLEKKSTDQLVQMLKYLDSKRAKNIDKHNRRRLIRAIEIVVKTKKSVPVLKKDKKFNTLILGVRRDKLVLQKRIKERLEKRLKQGMIKEVVQLKKTGLSWKRIEEFGLEYKFIAYYLQDKMKYDEMIERLQKAIENYAKRQMTWFKRDKQIHWIENKKTAKKLVKKFLK
ncbi:MAG: tRNA (adenosine(37)-N6)-dimethylallyltransferase MiaA [Patescibacteria group bacterium]|nr:tRNA (adenosine(37)-N6)-dimethylallyltransferase MiaA [Patescibacteria group bacterium]